MLIINNKSKAYSADLKEEVILSGNTIKVSQAAAAMIGLKKGDVLNFAADTENDLLVIFTDERGIGTKVSNKLTANGCKPLQFAMQAVAPNFNSSMKIYFEVEKFKDDSLRKDGDVNSDTYGQVINKDGVALKLVYSKQVAKGVSSDEDDEIAETETTIPKAESAKKAKVTANDFE